jgi:membrane associated rhomboid family serine protease
VFSLGASGSVMGLLAMVAAAGSSPAAARRFPARRAAAPLLVAVMLFVLFGLDPSADVLAHTGGFLAGVLVALAWRSRLAAFADSTVLNTSSGTLWLGAVVVAWAAALR